MTPAAAETADDAAKFYRGRTVQAIVEMWRRVGIKANNEVYEIAKHFDRPHRVPSGA